MVYDEEREKEEGRKLCCLIHSVLKFINFDEFIKFHDKKCFFHPSVIIIHIRVITWLKRRVKCPIYICFIIFTSKLLSEK